MTDTVEDSLATLIYAICKHFIGEPKNVQERSSEILNNLTCPKLHDFRWYKDMFMRKVFIRIDCNHSYWKESISGLPKLFAKKVRQRIRDSFKGEISYNNLSFGEIINYINIEELHLCTDLKLKAQMKKDGITTREELGDLCTLYSYKQIRALSRKKKKLEKKKRRF